MNQLVELEARRVSVEIENEKRDYLAALAKEANHEQLLTSISQDLTIQTINEALNELNSVSCKQVDDDSHSTKSCSNGIEFLT